MQGTVTENLFIIGDIACGPRDFVVAALCCAEACVTAATADLTRYHPSTEDSYTRAYCDAHVRERVGMLLGKEDFCLAPRSSDGRVS